MCKIWSKAEAWVIVYILNGTFHETLNTDHVKDLTPWVAARA